jgi:glucose/arabinose dehydrogenase
LIVETIDAARHDGLASLVILAHAPGSWKENTMGDGERRHHTQRLASLRVWLTALATSVALGLAVTATGQPAGDFDHVTLELVTAGLTAPLELTTPPNDERRFVAEQTGLIHILDERGDPLAEPFLDLADRLVAFRPGFDERGLLGLAFHPAYADNGRFFVYYSAPLRQGSLAALNHTARISEFRVSDQNPNLADPESERIVLEVDQPAFNHNGGQLAFGPDGYLYIAFGDGGASRDVGPFHPPKGNAQDITTLLGSILRIDVDADDGRGYAVPDDNPFVADFELDEDRTWSGTAAGFGARDEIYLWGVRNPFRFSFDRETGDMWIGDVGQGMWEAHHLVTEPGNLGWRIMEGDQWFDPDAPLETAPEGPTTGPHGEALVMPVIVYGNVGNVEDGRGISTTGGYVYRGSAIPELQGHYVFGDWSQSFTEPGGKLFVAAETADGEWEFVLDRQLDHFVLSLGEDADGELYLLTSESNAPQGDTGRVWRLVSEP